MAILAECDICGTQHRVKDGLVGSSIRCTDCGVKIIVPTDQFITPEAFIDEGGRLRRREPERPTSVWTWFVAIAVTILVLVALVVAIWLFAALVGPAPKQARRESNVFSLVVARSVRTRSGSAGETFPA